MRKLVTRAGRAAGPCFPVHLNMLLHACGFKLAKDGPRHPGAAALPFALLDFDHDRPIPNSLGKSFSTVFLSVARVCF